MPKDALDGMQALKPLEELAYRRIIDLIYVTDNNLDDDDERMGWMTKTGKKWKIIKQELIRLGKIEASGGKITNPKCSHTLEETHQFIAQKSQAGVASAEKRKSMKSNDTTPTDVDQPLQREGQREGNQSLVTSLKVSKSRGTRFALTLLPDEWKDFCQQERPDLDPDAVFSRFKDHWTALPGQKGCKLDWLATWRNWVRNTKSFTPNFYKTADKDREARKGAGVL